MFAHDLYHSQIEYFRNIQICLRFRTCRWAPQRLKLWPYLFVIPKAKSKNTDIMDRPWTEWGN